MTKEALVGNAADEQQVETGKRKERSRKQAFANAMRATLANRDARRVLWWILGGAGVEGSGLFESPEASTDAMTYRNIGRSDMARQLLKEINDIDPEAFIRMQQEVNEEKKRDG